MYKPQRNVINFIVCKPNTNLNAHHKPSKCSTFPIEIITIMRKASTTGTKPYGSEYGLPELYQDCKNEYINNPTKRINHGNQTSTTNIKTHSTRSW